MTPPLSARVNDLGGGRFAADAHADAAIARILGEWPAPHPVPLDAGGPLEVARKVAAQWDPHWQRLNEVTDDFKRWDSNRAVQEWRPPEQGMRTSIESALGEYLQAAHDWPEWGDAKMVGRAEQIFMENSVLSVMLLFCSSLPECYVLPDLSAVLQATGELVDHTDYRIRQTGAMIFPVMNEGGLVRPGQLGIAQVLKVRLIHATIRNLILRQRPDSALATFLSAPEADGAGVIAPIPGLEHAADMHHKLFGMGWDIGERGLPCNQEELAYTLLTFSYVYLRSLRVLGIGYGRADEEAFLHAWNVAGHFLGIERRWMVWTMDEARARFDAMQAAGRARIAERNARKAHEPDPRPALGRALMDAMEAVIPCRLLKPFPNLLAIELCGMQTARDLGIADRPPWASKALFVIVLGGIRLFDRLMRVFFPDFAIARWFGKKLGAPLTYKLMMDQTRALKLPTHLRAQIEGVLARWSKA
jgi:hypothetical protein